jgi:hypothetical protein
VQEAIDSLQHTNLDSPKLKQKKTISLNQP